MRAANSEVSIYFLSLGPKELDLMMSSEVIQKFPSRHPASSPEARDSIEDIIRNNHLKAKFTPYAEATIMGLLTYFFAWFIFCPSDSDRRGQSSISQKAC